MFPHRFFVRRLESDFKQGEERSMYRASVLLVAVLAVAAGAAADREEASIAKQIERLKKSEVNGWRKIPWTPSLLEARRASEREKQPIFLFTHDGNMDTGRC